jgi:hypothetical protein
VPLSATITVNRFVEFACVTSGRQVSTPLLGLRTAFVGAVGRLKVSGCAGTSLSVALFVMFMVTPTPMVWSGIAASAGAVLAGKTYSNTGRKLFVGCSFEQKSMRMKSDPVFVNRSVSTPSFVACPFTAAVTSTLTGVHSV